MPQYFQSHPHKLYPIGEKGDLVSESELLYLQLLKANLKANSFCSCSGEAVKARPYVMGL